MWITPFAIVPVQRHALVTRELVRDVERSISTASGDLDEAAVRATTRRLEQRQPVLAERLHRLLRGSRDEAAVALGYFLLIGVYLAFDRAFGDRLQPVSKAALEAVFGSLKLEAELRAERAEDPLEVEDVLAVQQPALFAWVAEHTESTLAPCEVGGAARSALDDEIDVNDVDAVLSEVSAFILALSYAVPSPGGHSHATASA